MIRKFNFNINSQWSKQYIITKFYEWNERDSCNASHHAPLKN